MVGIVAECETDDEESNETDRSIGERQSDEFSLRENPSGMGNKPTQDNEFCEGFFLFKVEIAASPDEQIQNRRQPAILTQILSTNRLRYLAVSRRLTVRDHPFMSSQLRVRRN